MREAGILLHISSLPSKYGIGSLGRAAYDFIDFLKKAGQHVWQILPIGPTSYGDAPYSSPSAFAFNTNFIDLEELCRDGLLDYDDLKSSGETTKIDYGKLYLERPILLHKAYINRGSLMPEFIEFCKSEAYWLDDYATYMALKLEQEDRPWFLWYDDFKFKNPESMRWIREDWVKKDLINEQKFFQFLFYRQWMRLKEYANKNGIKIMGDIPIYCAQDSCDVWAHPELFDLDDRLIPRSIAGCPPDAFTPNGQRWGNPLYNYEKMKEDGYSWWINRCRHSLKMFDILRIDHFRGFAGYYAIPAYEETAINGHWVTGPGYSLFEKIKEALPNAKIVAEDLGVITKDVVELMDKCEFPGMKIFEFELHDEDGIPLKRGYPENKILYTGTHDNETIMTFYNNLNKEDRNIVDELCDISFTDRPNLKIIEFCMKQKPELCIIPIQDYLGLSDSEGRMNIPGRASGNWSYITKEWQLNDEMAKYIRNITLKANRG